MGITGLEHRLRLGGIRGAQDLDPPARMLVARLGIGLDACLERSALAQVAAQNRVDVTLGVPALEQSTGAHRLVYHRVLGVTTGLQSVKRAPQQRFYQRITARAARELPHDGLHAAVAAQGAVREIDERSAGRLHVVLDEAIERRGKAHSGGDTFDHRRRVAQRRGEGAHAKRAPAGRRWPRRNSRALNRRPPARCNSDTASERSPHAMTSSSFECWTEPGSPDWSITRARQILTIWLSSMAKAPGAGRNARTARSSVD